MGVKRFFWDIVLPFILPIPVIWVLVYLFLWTPAELKPFSFFIIFFLHWLIFILSVTFAQYLTRKVSSIPRLIGKGLLSLLVGVFANFAAMMSNSMVDFLSKFAGWDRIVVGLSSLVFYYSVGVFNCLAILMVVIRQGSKNDLYTSNTEYVLYGLSLVISIFLMTFP